MLLSDLTNLPARVLTELRATTPLELAAALTGAAGVWLAARNRIANFPVGIVCCALYIAVFIRARLYSDAGLQVAFIALNAYGWAEWRRRGAAVGTETAPTVPISRTGPGLALGLAGAGLLYAGGGGYYFAQHTDAALPYYDSATTAVSLVAQYLLSRRKLENWLLWIAVDVVYVGMYWHRGLALTSLLYAVFLGLAAYGFWQWRREMVRW